MVYSTDGEIVGFQPTSRVGVNHWAANPLAKELYKGRKLSPGKILLLAYVIYWCFQVMLLIWLIFVCDLLLQVSLNLASISSDQVR